MVKVYLLRCSSDVWKGDVCATCHSAMVSRDFRCARWRSVAQETAPKIGVGAAVTYTAERHGCF
eukprot:scaffold7099_cov281-Pinguiococcus_pyrenoidosus.AAC.6